MLDSLDQYTVVGVPPGATIDHHTEASKFVNPASTIVGTSGRVIDLWGDVTARKRYVQRKFDR
jgi:hypothetical protein